MLHQEGMLKYSFDQFNGAKALEYTSTHKPTRRTFKRVLYYSGGDVDKLLSRWNNGDWQTSFKAPRRKQKTKAKSTKAKAA